VTLCTTQMTSRERVIAAIDFTGPDRVPQMFCALPSAYAVHKRLPDLYARYASDFAGEDGAAPQVLSREFTAGQWTDEWHCTWSVLRSGWIGQVTGHPLANFDRLRDFQWPDPREAPGLDDARQLAANRGTKYLRVGWMTFWERMIGLVGFQTLLTELALGNPAILEIRDRVAEYNVGLTHELLKLDPDGVYFSDDWGTQIAMMISPKLWRELFLPAYRRQFEPPKAAGKHVFMHSDGVILEIMPDLVDAGVNVFWSDLMLNPLAELRRRLGGKVCFQTLTDVQFAARNGTPDQIRQYVCDLIAALGSFHGGVIGCHEVASDQPWENVVAMIETMNAEAPYPLRIRWDEQQQKAVPC
jgi:uroporphyrinogen decarboxylase